ncbi:MAG: RNA-binding S4 domain-containing protein [Clostridia bacterium]|nr:RNA-binding S4 domain-containing protein [Clostridia bacterium]
MRLDKYLKVSRLIKRRTVASDACSASRVNVNGKPAKPAHDVKVGDILEISLGVAPLKVEVVRVTEHAQKADADSMYRVIE